MGVWLLQQQMMPDYVISSPAERAINTAHKCCKSMNVPVSTIIKDERVYMASLDALLAVLADAPGESQRIMLVGQAVSQSTAIYAMVVSLVLIFVV